MSANSRKAKTGLPMSFPAGVYNDLLEVIREHKRGRSLGGAAQRGAPATETRVLLKNDSGSAITAPFSVLEVSGRLGAAEDYRNKKTLRGVTPTSAARPVAILQAGAAAGELVEAVVAGTTLARVNVVATSDRYADAVAGDRDKLRSGAAGRFELVEPATSTGIQTVQVRFTGGAAPTGLPKVRNMTGLTVPEWGFLMIDGAEPLPSVDLPGFTSSPVFRGFMPGALTVFGNRRIVSVPGGAAPGAVVDCIMDGRVPARIFSAHRADPLMVHHTGDFSSNAVRRLEALHDQTSFGFPVLFRESGTGERWGLVDLSPQNQPAVIVGEVSNPGIGGTVPVGTGGIFNYQGFPFPSLQQNGLVSTLINSSGLRVSGPSAWMGELVVFFNVRYQRLPLAGTSGFYRLPGFRINAGVRFAPGGFSAAISPGGTVSSPPGLCTGADLFGSFSSPGGPSGAGYSLSLPFFFQSAAGPPAKNNAEISLTVSCQAFGGQGSGELVFGVTSAALLMHEVDPMLARFAPSSGSSSGGGFLASGSLPDPFAPFRDGVAPATGFLRSGGLSNSSTGSGSGFE